MCRRFMNDIYLDACSTTRLDPAVARAMADCLDAGYVNPASQHRAGQVALARIELARDAIRDSLMIGKHDRVIFTSGGTEANNLAVLGLSAIPLPASAAGQRPNIIVSAIEHPSILGSAESLRFKNFDIRQLPVSRSGVVDVGMLDEWVNEQTRLVCLMLVNNETGVIQPVAEAARICRQKRVLLHCDAVQGVAKIPVDFRALSAEGVSSMTITPHKFHGPRGIGALVLAGSNLPLVPLFFGGFQQLGLRPGTEDVTLTVGFAEAVRSAVAGLDDHRARLSEMQHAFESRLRDAIPDVVINGFEESRSPHCSSLAFPGDALITALDRQLLMLACDAQGVAISTGSACASGSSDPSHVLMAMGLERHLVDSSVRVSFSRQNSLVECLDAADRIIKTVKHLRRTKSSRK